METRIHVAILTAQLRVSAVVRGQNVCVTDYFITKLIHQSLPQTRARTHKHR